MVCWIGIATSIEILTGARIQSETFYGRTDDSSTHLNPNDGSHVSFDHVHGILTLSSNASYEVI
jgi:hypothetical protein